MIEAVGSVSTIFEVWTSTQMIGQYEDHPKALNSYELRAVITAILVTSSKLLTKKFQVSHMTILHELKRTGKVSEDRKQGPCSLSPRNLQQCVTYLESLRTQQHQMLFFDRLVTSDKKWILYHNIKRCRQWISRGSRPPLQQRGQLCPKEHVECYTVIKQSTQISIAVQFVARKQLWTRSLVLQSTDVGAFCITIKLDGFQTAIFILV